MTAGSMRRVGVAVGLAVLMGASAVLVHASSTPAPAPGDVNGAAPSPPPEPHVRGAPAMALAGLRVGVADCRGVRISPSESIQRTIDRHREGTTFCLTRGIHRLPRPLVPKSDQSFVGERGAVLSGAERLRSFDRAGAFWSVGGQTQQGPVVGFCSPASYTGCVYPEQVFIDDRSLWQVTERSDLGLGDFFFDYGANTIYLADDPNGHSVETSVVPQVFESSSATGVTIEGLVIEKFANPAQRPALQLGQGWAAIGNEIRLNHGVGIEADSNSVVRRNYVHDQGQLGISGYGSNRARIIGNEIAFNNTAGFDAQWEAGGGKWVRTTRLTVRHNYVHDNDGQGLWTDTDNIHTLYQGNHVTGNTGAGIFHETSYDAVIRKNYVARNASINDWLDGAGILIANSRDVEIYDNHVVRNGDGIALKQSDRGSGAYGPWVVENVFVHDNTIVMCSGWTGVGATDDASTSIFEANNRFQGNHYRLDSRSALRWFWNDDVIGREGWQDLGQDTSGTFEVSDAC